MKLNNKDCFIKTKNISSELNIYYPIESHGNLGVTPSEIRIELIKDRLNPIVPFPHKHGFFQIQIIKSGSGVHEIDFIRHEVLSHQLFIIKPGQVHECIYEKDVEGFVIEFKCEALNSNFPLSSDLINQLHSAYDKYYLQNNELQNINSICELMHSDFVECKFKFDISVQSFLVCLIVQIARIVNAGNKTLLPPKTLSEKFLELVNNHYKQEHSVTYYAEILGVSVKTLIGHLNKTHGVSPKQLIQKRFILEAKRLLSYSSLSVSEVGYEIGFEDPNYFSRFFRSHEKMTPLEFREKFRSSTLDS
jgi:AraC family transcriptional activator of pobA